VLGKKKNIVVDFCWGPVWFLGRAGDGGYSPMVHPFSRGFGKKNPVFSYGGLLWGCRPGPTPHWPGTALAIGGTQREPNKNSNAGFFFKIPFQKFKKARGGTIQNLGPPKKNGLARGRPTHGQKTFGKENLNSKKPGGGGIFFQNWGGGDSINSGGWGIFKKSGGGDSKSGGCGIW